MQQIQNQKILVTGGAGFIGSNLCEHLLECNNKVVCFDNFAIGKTQNIQQLLQNPNFTLIVGDIRNLADCHKAAQGVDYILHEAALGSVPRSINDPITNNDVYVFGFLKMLVIKSRRSIFLSQFSDGNCKKKRYPFIRVN